MSKAVVSNFEVEWSSIIKEFVKSFEGIGKLLSHLISILINRLSGKILLKDKILFILLDDVYKAIGLENIDKYTKWIYELISRLKKDYEIKCVVPILSTSEGISKRILAKHTYVKLSMIWNLNKEASTLLVKQINPEINIDKLWKYIGGNPRALIDLWKFYNWNFNEWFNDIVLNLRLRVESLLEKYKEELIKAVRDIDEVSYEVKEKLEDLGLAIRLYKTIDSKFIEPNLEIGTGVEWTWQIPVYRYALAKILSIELS